MSAAGASAAFAPKTLPVEQVRLRDALMALDGRAGEDME